MKKLTRLAAPWALLFLLVACGGGGATQGDTTSGDGDGAAAQGDKEEVALENPGQAEYRPPSPGEVLSALDRLGEVDWNALAVYPEKTEYDSESAQALNLGVRVADALAAARAEKMQTLKGMQTGIRSLAQALGIADSVETQISMFNQLATGGEWSKVTREVDNLQAKSQAQVEALGRQHLALLIKAGGWLEGMRIISGHIKDNFEAENTDLLAQKQLIGYFVSEFGKLEAGMQSDPMVMKAKGAMESLQTMLDGNAELSQENVAEMYRLTDEAVQAIVK